MDNDPSRLRYSRKNVYIDKDFQSRFILKFCVLVVLGATVTIVLLYWLSLASTSVSFVNARVKVMTTADYLLPLLIQTVLLVTVLVGLGAIGVTLIVSHKIAGPLFRFKQTFKELSDGNFTSQVSLRKGDQLLPVAGDFNQMIGVVRARLMLAKSLLIAMKTDVEAQEIPQQHRDEVRKKILELEKTLDFFKV